MLINATARDIYILSTIGVDFNPYTQSYLAAKENINILKKIPVSGIVSKVQIFETSGEPICGIPTKTVTFGEIENLPDQEQGVFYIVSALVAITAKARGRTDVLTASQPVYDGEEPCGDVQILGYLVLEK